MARPTSAVPCRGATPCRRALHSGVLLLCLSASGLAEAMTLEALLQLPLERLLQLQISTTHVDRSGHAR